MHSKVMAKVKVCYTVTDRPKTICICEKQCPRRQLSVNGTKSRKTLWKTLATFHKVKVCYRHTDRQTDRQADKQTEL